MARVTRAQAQGPRSYQEDRLVVQSIRTLEGQEGLLLAVLDGHGGSEVAEYGARRIPELVTPGRMRASDMRESLRELVATLVEETAHYRAGSTLSIAVVMGGFVDIAVLGDSPVLVVGKDGELWQGPEHNVRTNEADAQTVRDRGGATFNGYVYNVASSYAVQLTRALGDAPMGNILIHRPELFTRELGSFSTVVLCTDGMIDPAHGNSDDLAREISFKAYKEGWPATDILGWRERRGLEDNATIVVHQPD